MDLAHLNNLVLFLLKQIIMKTQNSQSELLVNYTKMKLFIIIAALSEIILIPNHSFGNECVPVFKENTALVNYSVYVNTYDIAAVPMPRLFERLFVTDNMSSIQPIINYTDFSYTKVIRNSNGSGITRAVTRHSDPSYQNGDKLLITQSEFLVPSDIPKGLAVNELKVYDAFNHGLMFSRRFSDGTKYEQGYKTIRLNGLELRQQKFSAKLSANSNELEKIVLVDDEIRSAHTNDKQHLSVTIANPHPSQNDIKSIEVRIALDQIPGTIINWISHPEGDQTRLLLHLLKGREIYAYQLTIGKQKHAAYYPDPYTALYNSQRSTVEIRQVGVALTKEEISTLGFDALHREFQADNHAPIETAATIRKKYRNK